MVHFTIFPFIYLSVTGHSLTVVSEMTGRCHPAVPDLASGLIPWLLKTLTRALRSLPLSLPRITESLHPSAAAPPPAPAALGVQKERGETRERASTTRR